MNGGGGEAVLVDEGMTERIALGELALTDEPQVSSSEERFAELVERRSRFVFRVAHAVLRNSHDAEDVAQDVFLKLYRSGAWAEMKDEKAYLARVAWRAAVDRRAANANGTGEILKDDSASGERTPEEAAVQANWSAVVQRLIDGLPDELRLPLALTATGELTSGEIAETLGIPEGTVRTRLMRARQILKEKLGQLAGGSLHGR